MRNSTRKAVPSLHFFNAVLQEALRAEKLRRLRIPERNGGIKISLAIVAKAFLRSMNRSMRGKNTACDELSFCFYDKSSRRPMKHEYIGEIFIAVSPLKGRAQKRYYAQSFLHALFHVFGYNHEGRGLRYRKDEKLTEKFTQEALIRLERTW